MSLKNLGNKQTIVLDNCQRNNQKYDIVITPHTQTIGYIRTKRQKIKRKIISKKRQITRKDFKAEVSNLDALYKLKDSVNKN